MAKNIGRAELKAQLQDQIDQARRQLKAAVERSGKTLVDLRQKAADAALSWVMAHDDRVKAFRRSVKGTPVEKAFDALLKLLRSEAHPAPRSRRAPAARRRTPARKRSRARKSAS